MRKAKCALAMGALFCGSLVSGVAHANMGASDYLLQIDCSPEPGGPNYAHTGTNIRVEFMVNGSWMVAEYVDGSGVGSGAVPATKCDAQFELGGFLGSKVKSGKLQKIRVIADGNDQFWIDRLKLTNLVTSQVATWGVNGGRGYCLSTDPADADSHCWNDAAYTWIDFIL